MDAESALKEIESTQNQARRRAAYSRSFAIALAAWAGLVTVAVGTAALLPVLAVGAIGYWWWRRGHGAIPREVESRAQLILVLAAGAAIGLVMVLSAFLRDRLADPAISWYLGAAVACVLLALTELGRPAASGTSS